MVLVWNSGEENGLYCYDFAAASLEKLDFDTESYTVEDCIAGENGMAFTAVEQDQDGLVRHLYRFDPSDRSIACTGVSISARNDVRVELLALLPDGSIQANYSVHPGEQEVFLVPGTEAGAQ